MESVEFVKVEDGDGEGYETKKELALGDIFLKVCRTCEIPTRTMYCGKSIRGSDLLPVHRDPATKKWWDGNRCPLCTRKYTQDRNRAKGIKSIHDVLFHKFRKARWAENLVLDYFIAIGFDAHITEHLGPDIVVALGDRKFNVEVKSVMRTKDGLRVGYVDKNRVNDEYIAIVFGTRQIWIEKMKTHLLKVGPKTGVRNVGDIWRTLNPTLHWTSHPEFKNL